MTIRNLVETLEKLELKPQAALAAKILRVIVDEDVSLRTAYEAIDDVKWTMSRFATEGKAADSVFTPHEKELFELAEPFLPKE